MEQHTFSREEDKTVAEDIAQMKHVISSYGTGPRIGGSFRTYSFVHVKSVY